MSVKEFWGTIGQKLSAFKKACIRTCTLDGEADRTAAGAPEPPSRYESEDFPPVAMAEQPKGGECAEQAADRTEDSWDARPSNQHADEDDFESADQAGRNDEHADQPSADENNGLSVRARQDELADTRPVIDPDDLRELMDALRILPDSMSSLSTALREQLALPGQIAQALEKFRESGIDDEILESMRDLATEAKNQTDCLNGIQQSMHTAEQTQQKVIQSLAQLNEATETNNRATASQAELMEQVRDHLSSANDELRDQVEAHTNQLKKLGIVVMAVLIAGMLAIIAAILIK